MIVLGKCRSNQRTLYYGDLENADLENADLVNKDLANTEVRQTLQKITAFARERIMKLNMLPKFKTDLFMQSVEPHTFLALKHQSTMTSNSGRASVLQRNENITTMFC